ncbi:unnamed protein product [Microthlaspi erraticum]|uniref:Pectate lyase domain-containing protein n=1 Tax=Microthlaspi erraticum TaxID=1685480 RepID=A0A6D2I6P5_9BRAS|nr:unnamed protein product [Microthlaspi erraticum]
MIKEWGDEDNKCWLCFKNVAGLVLNGSGVLHPHGDDCVAINGGSYNINISHVACGPGHGISIGSLGRGEFNETVENVKVTHCTFNGTSNGARIKT